MYAATGANRAQWWRLQPVVDALDFAAIAIEWRGGGVDGSDGPRCDYALEPCPLQTSPSTWGKRPAIE